VELVGIEGGVVSGVIELYAAGFAHERRRASHSPLDWHRTNVPRCRGSAVNRNADRPAARLMQHFTVIRHGKLHHRLRCRPHAAAGASDRPVAKLADSSHVTSHRRDRLPRRPVAADRAADRPALALHWYNTLLRSVAALVRLARLMVGSQREQSLC
jgi:hypothetical protein